MRLSLLKLKVILGVAVGCSSLLLATTLQAQNFYKWVDKNGSTHYTLTPPPANAKTVGQVPTYSDHVTYTAPATTSTTSAAEEAKKPSTDAVATSEERTSQSPTPVVEGR